MGKKKLTTLQKISLILKMSIGSAISWEIAAIFGSKHPYLAPISVILCLQATMVKSVRFSISRIVSTIIGVASVLILASSLHPNGWTIGLIMFISLIIPFVFKGNSTMLHQTALSVLFVFVFEHKLHGYGIDRIRDTIIGVIIGLLLHMFFHPPNFTKKALEEVEELPNLLMEKLESLSVWLESGASGNNYFEEEMNRIHKQFFQAEQRVKKAKSSLHYNPLSQKSNTILSRGEAQLKTMNEVAVDLNAMYEIINMWKKAGTLSKEEMAVWTQNFLLMASTLQSWKEGKTITDIQLKETITDENYSYPALWHARQFVHTLKTKS
ncbi:FUSC family protein [Lederbergia citrea]|uniref:FUSC family protein n=1 Tax=Lederbergia citrea TaxID=2833581 RepID=UPI001BC99CA2|nr:FUSC family protein [Lederbergia citrea]MBS4178937.1 FUSC family protein [Lederbergia citrea]MBS4205618.1 FUSC family protein [Lederbergia citrea]